MSILYKETLHNIFPRVSCGIHPPISFEEIKNNHLFMNKQKPCSSCLNFHIKSLYFFIL